MRANLLLRNRPAQLAPEIHPKNEECHNHRQHRRHNECLEPRRQRRHLRTKHHQVCRIRDGQHEPRRICNECTSKQIRQRLCLRLTHRCHDRGRQHHRRRIVRQEHRDHRAHQVHQHEQPKRDPRAALLQPKPSSRTRQMPAPVLKAASCRSGTGRRLRLRARQLPQLATEPAAAQSAAQHHRRPTRPPQPRAAATTSERC